MGGVKVAIEHDTAALSGGLQELARATSNLTPFWRDVGEYLLRSTAKRFEDEEDPDGKPWATLSSRYRRRKKGPRILTESGRLRRLVYRASPTSLEIGTNLVYAKIHQFGGEVKQKDRTQVLAFRRDGRFMSRKAASRAKSPIRVAFATIPGKTRKIPARPFLGVSTGDEQEIRTLLEEHLARALAAAGAS